MKPLENHLPTYKIKFPRTDAEKKKVLSFFRRKYKGDYTRPILGNCEEMFDSCTMIVIVNKKVREMQRASSINQPNKETDDRTVFNFHCTIAHKGFTLSDAKWLLNEANHRLNDAIGVELTKI